ncbi:hypothetical protein NCCP1664_00940 [Zafaria cholistanensis]|uniref:Uncharacterized protein n=1 Tax=Zafaria cholistanensis TaxID=1682741 RepID=A0A5A7NNG4_9MICC|nr:hypothetical protein NCCP1664_00940 [Zafaria cholistanensis]
MVHPQLSLTPTSKQPGPKGPELLGRQGRGVSRRAVPCAVRGRFAAPIRTLALDAKVDSLHMQGAQIFNITPKRPGPEIVR